MSLILLRCVGRTAICCCFGYFSKKCSDWCDTFVVLYLHLQGSQQSWISWNFKVVLKLSWILRLSWNLCHIVEMSWYWPLLCPNMWLFMSNMPQKTFFNNSCLTWDVKGKNGDVASDWCTNVKLDARVAHCNDCLFDVHYSFVLNKDVIIFYVLRILRP